MQIRDSGGSPPCEKRTPCLTTLLIFFQGDRGGPERMVDLRQGLGYRVLTQEDLVTTSGITYM
jgi:hypothetical protein